MEQESFEDMEVATMLNENFISIKVDKEERADIDSIYMRVCQAFTGSGGWPTSIFMTCEQKPFFAGTYFPKDGFIHVLKVITEKWKVQKEDLLENSNAVALAIENQVHRITETFAHVPFKLADQQYQDAFDSEYGGFGEAPKFPSPHNLFYLLQTKPDIAEKTLVQMYKGGIFDHIGYGFSRYSTDKYWLVPHFEKMLYDNALLALAYLFAYEKTKKPFYAQVAEEIFTYVERELQSPEGGFYAAQDADSDGVEGKFYVFSPDEIVSILGEKDGEAFNAHFGITDHGNFEGKSIPNLLHHQGTQFENNMKPFLDKVYGYRNTRTSLHRDEKVLTAWNGLMIAAYAHGYRLLKKERYLSMAENGMKFIEKHLMDSATLYVSYTNGKLGAKGFLDEYANTIFALLSLHQGTLENRYLESAIKLCEKTVSSFFDEEQGGFFLNGKENEKLLYQPKETYDGAMPSGNSVMAYNLSRLAGLTKEEYWYQLLEKQKGFMNGHAKDYPMGFGFYLFATLPTKEIVCAMKQPKDIKDITVKWDWNFSFGQQDKYPLEENKTTYYICQGTSCLPPTHSLPES